MKQEEWREFKYRYENPDFLNFLVDILGEKGVQAGAYLEAKEMEEFREEKNNLLSMNEKEFMENFEKYKSLIQTMKGKGIIPGWCLAFNYDYRQNDTPEVKKLHTNRFGNEFSTVHDEPHLTLVHPENFTGGKWEGISFSNFEGEKSVRRFKESVRGFVEKGYNLIRVSANLNPQPYTSDHYNDGCDYDGHLFAAGGEMTLCGKFPEDFDFNRFVPKQLPQSQKMLEQLVRINKSV